MTERPVTAARQRATLSSIARRAGVSIATVSKVINGRAGVGADTRDLIEEIIEQVGYVSPGERQRIAARAQETSVELLVNPLELENPYFAIFLSGAIQAAAELHVALTVRDLAAAAAQPPRAWAQGLARAGRAGIIEVTSAYSAEREQALTDAGLPIVLVDPVDVPRITVTSVGATNWAGAYAATEHLLDLGHQRIRYVGGPPAAGCDIVRAHGWAAAMTERGLPADLTSVPRDAYSFAHGLAAATTLLRGESPPTAIFAGSDTTATGVLEAARRLGLDVPGDLSVVGFDDTTLAECSAPQLTTVHQPIREIAQTALSTVVRMARGYAPTSRRVEVATHLVVRRSTAPPDR